jgi:DNA-binding NarL/FixJ family response regulator
MAPIPILVADDPAQRPWTVWTAIASKDFEVVAHATDVNSAAELAREMQPRICLVHERVPGGGIVAAARIGRYVPSTRVLVVAHSETEEQLFRAILAGAAGYIGKSVTPAQLRRVLFAVLAGEAAIPRRMIMRLVNELRAHQDSPHARRTVLAMGTARLTEREWQALELLAAGLTTREIAQQLYVTAITVRSHLSSAVRKLKVPDRETALRVALHTQADGAKRDNA